MKAKNNWKDMLNGDQQNVYIHNYKQLFLYLLNKTIF